MSIVTIKVTFVVVVLSIVAAFAAIALDTQNAAAQSRYLAPSFNTSLVKHADVDSNPAMDFLWGSDDAAYRAKAEPVAHSSFVSAFFATIQAIILPNTAAPHGSVTCNVSDGHGGTFTVTRDSCSDL